MQPRSGRVARHVVAVALLAAAFQLPIFDRWWSHMDEGHVLLFSDLVAKGGELYRDATLYPLPGAFYLLAGLFDLFGASIRLSRWVAMLEFAAFAALLFVWMRRFTTLAGAWASVLLLLGYRIWAFPHWQFYSYTTTCLLAIAAAALCLLRSFDTGRRAWLAAAGLLFGLAVSCKQDYGAAALAAMTVALVVDARRRRTPIFGPLCVFVGAGAVVGAVAGLYFAARGVLPDLLQQTVLGHLRGIGAFEYSTYPPLFPLFEQSPEIRSEAGVFAYFPGIVTTVDLETLRQDRLFRETVVYDVALKLFYWGPYAFAAFAIARVLARERRLEEVLLAAFTAAFVLLLSLNRPQDFLHVAVLLWPMLCLGVVHLEALFSARRALALSLCGVLFLCAAPLLAYTARAYALLRTQNSERVEGERAGIFARPSEARMLGELTAFVQENVAPDETVAVVPYFPIAHFLADRAGPDRSAYIVWPFPEFPDRDQRIIRSLESKGTRTAVYNFTQFRTFPPMHEFAPELFSHLVDHFETVRVFSYDQAGYRLAGLRRSAVPETASPFLDAAWPGASLAILSDEAPPHAIGPDREAEFVRREPWPFRRALALRPSTSPRRTALRLPLRAKAGERLETAVSFHPDLWFALPPFEAHFEIAVIEAGVRRSVYARSLDPHRDTQDRRWFEVEVPLEEWAGRDVQLELSVRVDSERGESLLAGGFAEPRLVESPRDR